MARVFNDTNELCSSPIVLHQQRDAGSIREHEFVASPDSADEKETFRRSARSGARNSARTALVHGELLFNLVHCAASLDSISTKAEPRRQD
jgi:hypothetical protein